MFECMLQHTGNAFIAIMSFAFFSLYTLELRQAKSQKVPKFFAVAFQSGTYHMCMSWILLFFTAHFMFTYQEWLLQLSGILFFIGSFLYLLLYRGRIDILLSKGCRRH